MAPPTARTPQQIIQAAMADPDFTGFRERPEHDSGPFKVFQANLATPRYRGLQPNWYFAVLGQVDAHTPYASIPGSARALIDRAATTHPRLLPLVLLSDVPSARVADMCRFESRDVFGVDAPDLPSAKQANNPLRAPFIMAVRAKHGSTLLQPYSPKYPVEGWRFFGRRDELDELVNSRGNFFVVGARMTGKTSLLKEAARQLREEQGARVHFVPLQHLEGAHEIVREVLTTVAERESITAVRRSKMLDEPLLESVLKKMSQSSTQTILILDELGNVLAKDHHQRRTDWGLIGMLRQFSQEGNLRVIMSGFQEFLLRQSEYDSPFVNFAKTIRLSGFTNEEINEFLVLPLQFWGNIAKSELLTLVTTCVGRHPLLLQYFGKALFDKVARRANAPDVNTAAAHLLASDGIAIFGDAVDELFLRTCTAVQRHLYLRRCREADLKGEPIVSAEIDDEWCKHALEAIGRTSTYDSRRMLLESLELKALTTAVGPNRSRQRIAAPIIYTYMKYGEQDGLDRLIATLGNDAGNEPL